ncbi:MAG TPA: glycosyltransferase [Dehalococcoidia bacterium]|nr:glycosyltransferase [Dehalococcoidia bacterium]
MKILIATDLYPPDISGAAYFTYRFAISLAKRGHNVFVMCPSGSFKSTVSNDNGVTVYGIRSINIGILVSHYARISPLFISRTIRRAVEEIPPDIIHIQNHFLIGRRVVGAAKKLGIPVVGTNHFMPENLVHFLHLPEIAERELRKLAWRDCVRIFEQLDYVTTPTKTAAALLENAGFSKDVMPISCGIDLERFKPTNDGLYLKQVFAVPNNRPVLLYVGRLDKEKKIDVILQALPDILRVTSVHLVVVGMGREKQKLAELTGKLGIQNAVTFTGFVPDKDLQNIYRIADLFVIAGIAELQSIVTMEAMASGLPVVAANAMALPELVHDGENGYLFTDGDSRMLAEKVIVILSNPAMRAQMSQKSLEIIKEHDINKVIEKYESIYNEIINH